MKILSIISITFLIVFAFGCDEMQNQAMKPITMPDGEGPTEDEVVTSVGTMKDPSMDPDDSKEDTSPETQTMEEDPTEEPQTPVAAFVSASPADGADISENDSITTTFDNDPGNVTASEGTLSSSGNSRTISGPFTVGSLTLTISWTNGNGSHTLNYNVMADEPATPDAVFQSATPTSGSDISENDSITITFDNDPGNVTASEGTLSGSGNSQTISGPFTVGSLSLTISWTNGNGTHTLNYNVTTDEPATPDAVFQSATPTSGSDISENDSITITFDNDPGNVTASEGTLSGSGNSRTISGPFTVGSLALTITWTNGNGSHTLNYNVMEEDTTSPQVSTSSLSDGAVDVDPDAVSDITVTFDEPINEQRLKLLKDGVDVGWIATISGNTITLTKSTGQELSHDTTYKISGTVRDSAGNETNVSITFATKSAPVQQPTVSQPAPNPQPPLSPGEGLRIGTDAPDFTLSDGNGNMHSLSDFSGKIVIVFYRYRH